jgi:hypothetical protein
MAPTETPSPSGERLSEHAGRPSRPVLVGACPRSGTTLLRTMLHSHPELAMPRETRFVLESWGRRSTFGDLREEKNRRRLARWIVKRDASRFRRFGLDAEETIEELAAAPPTLGSLLATCFVLYAEKHEKPRWGDKRPTYAARMSVIWSLFPSAHFVNVVRDPRACVASMRKLGWYEGRVVPAVELWERSLRAVDAWRPRLAADQLLEVKYEDLVLEPEPVLAGIAAFAGLAADAAAVEQMLRYHEREEVRSERYHANVARPPDPSRVSGWTDVLEPGEVAFVEEASAPFMRRYGYEPLAEGGGAPAELRRELRRRRLRQAVSRQKQAWGDRVQDRVVHRRPLAAEPVPPRPRPADRSSSAVTTEGG